MKKTSIVCALGALAASGVLTTAVSADAADCTSYTNPVYIAGSTASQPIWAALAPSLPNISMIYMSPSSCVGLTEVTGGMGDGKQPLYMDPTNPSAQGVSCTFAATPPRLDIGVSDVFPATCAPAVAVGTGYKEFLGPVQVSAVRGPIPVDRVGDYLRTQRTPCLAGVARRTPSASCGRTSRSFSFALHRRGRS